MRRAAAMADSVSFLKTPCEISSSRPDNRSERAIFYLRLLGEHRRNQ